MCVSALDWILCCSWCYFFLSRSMILVEGSWPAISAPFESSRNRPQLSASLCIGGASDSHLKNPWTQSENMRKQRCYSIEIRDQDTMFWMQRTSTHGWWATLQLHPELQSSRLFVSWTWLWHGLRGYPKIWWLTTINGGSSNVCLFGM